MKYNKFINSWKIAALGLMAPALILTSCSPQNKFGRNIADDGSNGPLSAYQIYADLQESAMTFNAKGILIDGDGVVPGMSSGITYGAEKEASSGLITRIMTPDSNTFKQMVANLPEENRKTFLRDFMSNYTKNANGYRTFKGEDGLKVDLATSVKDLEGNQKFIDMEQLVGVDYDNAELDVLTEKFHKWLEMTDDRPLSFVKPQVRMKLFKGDMPGMTGSAKLKPSSNWGYTSWKPVFGKAEKYISDAHGHGGGVGGGWEIGFHPQQSYGEFEEMVVWFRKELKNAGKLFQAPGHQRMVFKKHPNLDEAKLAELYKGIQALIVIDGIKGNTGIEKANYKIVQSDSNLASLRTQRGVIRLEGSRWAEGTHGIEFRAGTKDIKAARFYQTVLASRVSTNDFSGLSNVGDWTLVPGSNPTASELASRFGVDEAKAQKALENLRRAKIKDNYMIPFWGWDHESNPILKENKRKFVKSLTKDFIEQAASLEGDNIETPARELLRSWTRSTRLSDELRTYLKPKRMASQTSDLLHFSPPPGRQMVSNIVDVNNIDLGIEYSGKLPLALDAEYSADKLADNKKAWLSTKIDLTPEERKAVIRNVAKDLITELGGEGEPLEVVDGGGHGHGLEVAFELRDSKNRKWIVEWDGIGRAYRPDGTIIPESVRGGSLELVTPKFTPEVSEIDAVYRALEKNNVMPSIKTGGGHINIDLAAFDGKPKQLARFMTLFHENRGIIALMFQYHNRLKSAEPIDIDPDLARSLKNFNGSEDELKKLLYDKKYFNTRYGRKTRYNQLDMSAYYQDIIPEEFLTDDFDINSPVDPWRRTFRVDPRIRKAEFRLFNAPRDSMESALQIRLVRALLNKALNEDDELSGVVQKVDHVDYLNNPNKAFADVEKMCNQLGLDVNDYRAAVAEGLGDTDLQVRSPFFQTLSQKLELHPKQPGWGNAVPPRSAANAIDSSGRAWTPGAADQLNTMTHEYRVRAATDAQRIRDSIVPNREIPGHFKRSGSCVDSLGAFF